MFGKPFWLNPPYALLFDLVRLHRLRPWDVKIAELLNSFLEEMRNRGSIDFYASAIALLSSSIIHRMKSELVLKMEEPPRPPPNPESEMERIPLPPPLPLPLKFEYATIPIEEILRSLRDVLLDESLLLSARGGPSFPQASPPSIDEFLVNIEKRISEFYNVLIGLYRELGESISFLRLISGLGPLEAIRRFIMLLFLANEGKVELFQEDGIGDIRIIPRIEAG
ncbi:MAG: hypothetical protein QXW19_04335 [Candidatus Bathyarchaeia archaeon]